MPKLPLLLGAIAIMLSSCGADEEKKASTGPVSPSPSASTPPVSTPSATAPAATATPPPAATATRKEPDAGDEEPISTPVMLTGRGAKISPRLVEVPAFIGVRVTLRSSDQLTYQLDFGTKTIGVDVEKRENSVVLSGLRAGRRYVGNGPNGRVVISATGEPGP